MKYKKIIGLFVLLMLSIAGFAQSTAFTKNSDGTWTLSAMPNYDVELAVEYEDATTPVADAIALTQNTDGTWYFLSNSQVQSDYRGLALYDGHWFYLENGKLIPDFTGEVEYDGEVFEFVDGKLVA